MLQQKVLILDYISVCSFPNNQLFSFIHKIFNILFILSNNKLSNISPRNYYRLYPQFLDQSTYVFGVVFSAYKC